LKNIPKLLKRTFGPYASKEELASIIRISDATDSKKDNFRLFMKSRMMK